MEDVLSSVERIDSLTLKILSLKLSTRAFCLIRKHLFLYFNYIFKADFF